MTVRQRKPWGFLLGIGMGLLMWAGLALAFAWLLGCAPSYSAEERRGGAAIFNGVDRYCKENWDLARQGGPTYASERACREANRGALLEMAADPFFENIKWEGDSYYAQVANECAAVQHANEWHEVNWDWFITCFRDGGTLKPWEDVMPWEGS